MELLNLEYFSKENSKGWWFRSQVDPGANSSLGYSVVDK
jgi:hypothetical protein